jgi:putative FmdB family regulatory protein
VPTYTFECEGCGHKVDVDRKFEDCYIPPEGACENCTEEKWRKLLNFSIMRYRFHD